MSKLGYFLGGVLTGMVALGTVAWFVGNDEHHSRTSTDDDGDGCLIEEESAEKQSEQAA